MSVYIIETRHSEGGKPVAVYFDKESALEQGLAYFQRHFNRLYGLILWETEPRAEGETLERKLCKHIATIDIGGVHLAE